MQAPGSLLPLLLLLLSIASPLINCDESKVTERRPYFRRKELIRSKLNPTVKVDYSSVPTKKRRLQTKFFNMKEDYATSTKTTLRYKVPILIKKLAKRPRKQNLCGDAHLLECARNQTSRQTFGGIETVFSLLREDVWVIPLLIGDVSLIIVLIVFEVFLLSKALRSNPSRRHLFLGQVLMAGLFLCTGISVSHVLKPNEIVCSVTRLGTGISYSIVFSTLLVKLVFLISLNSGVYLPGTYQCLLLCFAILIQVVIGVQWILSSPAQAKNGICDLEFAPFLFSLLYVFFLMGVVSLLAFKARKIRENYREGSYIGLVMVFSSCIFVIWIIGGFIAPIEYQPVGIGGGLLAVAAITFVIMFMPKGRQLSAIGKEGVYSEDRAGNRLYSESSLQSTGSGTPSPSFFPIKPAKMNFRERLATPPTPKKNRHGAMSETRREIRSSHINSSRHPVFIRASKQQHHHHNRHHHSSSSLLRGRRWRSHPALLDEAADEEDNQQLRLRGGGVLDLQGLKNLKINKKNIHQLKDILRHSYSDLSMYNLNEDYYAHLRKILNSKIKNERDILSTISPRRWNDQCLRCCSSNQDVDLHY
ncbi:uncharacterized protein [Lepeophtheirus salmonis]|uniref:uncharacterized protein isoform X1 n=1 Tax=Lepeophtheirus salmonis TaxID=72036 RepID=UPI001AE27FB6|nr:uncharacterized protein LOC121116117 isoform X1 [Lepeophtheirus salmonis]XP_040566274.1 uncharacterized protein LOC121116117 isoform X1 [Lepeophtheirus salmonis]XP_040566275.1 uncharacterized protein LOC121116117 isoform X1 [Lepeophtheirus salmonis]